ncbi:MAG: cobalamin B12-binding domain-containing protein [Deltaproteobacteria bacterium]|nr:cobalamin B12-binding domain-containing protein [Deltaproteobacteria bacterium]MBN2670366.1 cobalamin B12-binding domain-containing protein [Deltaproteobacteria bacterium]
MKNENSQKHVSIGGLSAGSGVPVETIRNWELRYGFPSPSRLDSGHRRYEMELISRLKKIKALVDVGYKPSFAVNLDDMELENLLLSGRYSADLNPLDENDFQKAISRWLTLTETMNVAEFTRALSQDWSRIGARRFIFELTLPFLREVGNRWESSALSVAHEHFASEVLQSFLASRWRPLISTNHNKKLVLANQEGDLHSLGLQMAAVLASIHNIEPIFLGPNTPLQDIIIAATEQKVSAVVIGLSSVSNPETSISFLKELKQGLLGVRLAFGGSKYIPTLSNIEYIASLEDFDDWCRHI